MLYSARKHKKQAAPGSCLAVKHIYTMMSVAVPKVCFGLRGQKKWNLVHQINSRQKKQQQQTLTFVTEELLSCSC